MTLDEAIKHAEEVAERYGESECASNHKQIAEWLKELKQRRILDEGRNHAMQTL